MTKQETDAAVEPESQVLKDLTRLKCDLIISNHVMAAAAAGLIPVPLLDLATIGGVQLDMLYRLCRTYGIDFSEEAARSAIAAVLGCAVSGLQPTFLTGGSKLIPGIGVLASLFVTPALAGAATYALGKVFVQHLESNGTLLTFDAQKMRSHFEHALNEDRKYRAGSGSRT